MRVLSTQLSPKSQKLQSPAKQYLTPPSIPKWQNELRKRNRDSMLYGVHPPPLTSDEGECCSCAGIGFLFDKCAHVSFIPDEEELAKSAYEDNVKVKITGTQKKRRSGCRISGYNFDALLENEDVTSSYEKEEQQISGYNFDELLASY